MTHAPMTVTLKPATPGLRVTMPGTREALPADGAVVELDSYWRERIRDGSVLIVEPEQPAMPAAGSTRAARATKKD